MRINDPVLLIEEEINRRCALGDSGAADPYETAAQIEALQDVQLRLTPRTATGAAVQRLLAVDRAAIAFSDHVDRSPT